MDTDAFDLQEIKKSGTVFLCFDIVYSLMLAADNVIYLSLVIINESGSSYNQIVVMKTVHNTTLRCIPYSSSTTTCHYFEFILFHYEV